MFQNPKIVLSPTYAYLQQEIRKIPAGDYRILETYCDRRNMVRKIELAGGRIFVLKQYKRPTRLNQFAYTLFRKSKACRAYEYALRLQQLGFETAAPVAYLEISRHGLFHTGYFLSEFIAHPLLNTLQEGDEESRKILEDFAAFIDRKPQIFLTIVIPMMPHRHKRLHTWLLVMYRAVKLCHLLV